MTHIVWLPSCCSGDTVRSQSQLPDRSMKQTSQCTCVIITSNTNHYCWTVEDAWEANTGDKDTCIKQLSTALHSRQSQASDGKPHQWYQKCINCKVLATKIRCRVLIQWPSVGKSRLFTQIMAKIGISSLSNALFTFHSELQPDEQSKDGK